MYFMRELYVLPPYGGWSGSYLLNMECATGIVVTDAQRTSAA